MFSKKTNKLANKNNNLKKLLKSNMALTFELDYPRVAALLSNDPHFTYEF
jgi:hypothetical protein